MSKDLYRILEVDKNADEKKIKESYRRLARKYHPDLNPGDKAAEAKFKEVQGAYEVLGDPEKRAKYDQFGSNWEQMQHGGGAGDFFGSPGGADFSDIFSQFFTHMGSGGVQESRRRGVEPRDIERVVELTLEEIDSGSKRTLTYQVDDACKSCDGTGQVRLNSKKPCLKCGGTGQLRTILGAQVCDQCGGSGQSTLERCPSCRGEGTTTTTKKVDVNIPAGITDGKKLRVPGRGAVGSNGRNGDLYVVIRELPHTQFTRKGEDLETEVMLPFTLAALGGEVQVPTLRGQVKMKVPECTQNGQLFRLADQGIARLKGGRGNLLVRVRISVPKSLSKEQRKLIEQLAATEKVKA